MTTSTLPGLGTALLVVVRGDPVGQGSKAAFAVSRKGADGQRVYTGKVAVVDDTNKGHREAGKQWRAAVTDAAADALAGGPPLTGAVGLRATFTLARPKGHFGTGRNAQLLRPSAPRYPAVKPDEDKLTRAVKDALTAAGVYRDDAQVTDSHVCKRYPVRPWEGDGTLSLDRLPDPTVLCGVADADVLAAPGVVLRVWEMP